MNVEISTRGKGNPALTPPCGRRMDYTSQNNALPQWCRRGRSM